jgi:hypothetical protein
MEHDPAAIAFVVSASQNPSGTHVAKVQVAGVCVAAVHVAPSEVHVADVHTAAVHVRGDTHAALVLMLLSEHVP